VLRPARVHAAAGRTGIVYGRFTNCNSRS
jgi:hypothetical protein